MSSFLYCRARGFMQRVRTGCPWERLLYPDDLMIIVESLVELLLKVET